MSTEKYLCSYRCIHMHASISSGLGDMYINIILSIYLPIFLPIYFSSTQRLHKLLRKPYVVFKNPPYPNLARTCSLLPFPLIDISTNSTFYFLTRTLTQLQLSFQESCLYWSGILSWKTFFLGMEVQECQRFFLGYCHIPQDIHLYTLSLLMNATHFSQQYDSNSLPI